MMRVLVDAKALEALCEAAEGKHRLLVNRVRTSVRAEPKAEAITKVAGYGSVFSAEARPEPVEVLSNYDAVPASEACTFTPRKRSAVSQSDT